MNTPKSRLSVARLIGRTWIGLCDVVMIAVAVLPPFVAFAIAAQIG